MKRYLLLILVIASVAIPLIGCGSGASQEDRPQPTNGGLVPKGTHKQFPVLPQAPVK